MSAVLENPCVPDLLVREGRAIPRGSTARTEGLLEEMLRAACGTFAEQARLYAEAPVPEGTGRMMADAYRFAWAHPRLTPVVRDGELIVGGRLRNTDNGPGWCWYPDGGEWYIAHFAKNTPPDRPDIRDMAGRGLISPQGSLNHKAVDYAGYIRTGSLALARRARRKAESLEGEAKEFALAFAMGHEAMIAHARAYRKACEEAARLASPARAAELREIALICERVPAHPARTFREALQSFWFAYMVAGDATGRIDVFLNDFYRADLEAGRITPEEAQELIECLLIKLHGDVMEGIVNVSSVQTMTLGGLLPDGSDGTSDLTRLFLRAIRSVRLLRPTVYIRCHDRTPPDILDLAVSMLGEGLSEPNFYGDRPIVAGLTRLGIPLEEARDYALSGCTEVVSPGLGNWGAPNGWINLALLAHEALEDAAGQGAADMESFWRILEAHTERLTEACQAANVWVDEQVSDTRYSATLLMPVCLEKCRDIAHGGAKTHMGHWEAIGLPNAADMIYSAQALSFQGGEPLASLMARIAAEDTGLLAAIRRLPKFGNGSPEVDGIAARLVSLVADSLERRSTPLRPALAMGHLAGGENMHIPYGSHMGATLDGRRARQPLADSLASSQGQANAGPTALIHSLCALDHSRLVAGNVSTLRLGTDAFATPDSRAKIAALIRSFIVMGGSQLQINVADAETLRKAQERPEDYAGLIVRVAGYSADFTRLGRSLQDEIIARTEGLSTRTQRSHS
ncbi:MAG: hypothetical protein IT210_21095 [Armatimonadetes bacterium]|nr:hypothetical protein [Armatimonadota bacterium]